MYLNEKQKTKIKETKKGKIIESLHMFLHMLIIHSVF